MSTTAPPPATRVHSVRCSDEDWAAIQAAAKAAGQSTNAFLIEGALRPSFSSALQTVSVLQDHGGIEQVLELAGAPRLEVWAGRDLRDLGQQLVALAKRWPR